MSRDVLIQLTLALQKIIHQGLTAPGLPDQLISIGPPVPGLVGTRVVSLFPFHLVPNTELRNAERYAEAAGAQVQQDALPVDVRYLISVFRPAGAAEPSELERLGEIVAALHAHSTIGGALLPNQEVRLTPEPYPMEELSRIWGLFPNASYVTSMVYLASPVFIDAAAVVRGAPVEGRRLDTGQSAEPPDVFGDRRVREGAAG